MQAVENKIKIEPRRRKGSRVFVLDIDGNLSAGESAEYMHGFIISYAKQNVRQMVLNLEGVGYADFVGLELLAAAQKRMRRRGGEIKLLNPRPRVLEMLFKTGLFGSVFTVYVEEDKVVGSFASR